MKCYLHSIVVPLCSTQYVFLHVHVVQDNWVKNITINNISTENFPSLYLIRDFFLLPESLSVSLHYPLVSHRGSGMNTSPSYYYIFRSFHFCHRVQTSSLYWYNVCVPSSCLLCLALNVYLSTGWCLHRGQKNSHQKDSCPTGFLAALFTIPKT